MSQLALVAVILGGVVTVLYMPLILVPGRAREWIRHFPRSRWIGWLLTAVDMAWVAWLISDTSFGRFDYLKPYMYALTPAIFFLIVIFMDELLSPRALGGLFLLVAAPMLSAAHCHESRLKLVIVVLAYLIVIKGMILMLSPYHFRKKANFWTKSNGLCRTWGITGLVFGIFILLLGFLVY